MIKGLSRKTAIIASSVLVVGAVSSAMALNSSTGASENPPIVQQVDKHEQQLANHEARLSNTENDVTDLQNKTNTPPSTTRVVVPVVAPKAKITVASYEMIYLDDRRMDCKFTYSDNTTYQWHFSYVDSQGLTVTDGICDTTRIGTEKP